MILARSLTCLALTTSFTLTGCLDLGLGDQDAGVGGKKSTSTSVKGGGNVTANPCSTVYTPCGGNVTGTWVIQSICADRNMADAVNESYAQYSYCATACRSASVTAKGSKTYGTGVVTDESFTLFESLSLEETCLYGITGAALSAASCQMFGNGLGTAACSVASGYCNCDVTSQLTNSANSYSISGNVLTELDVDNLKSTTVPYCVMGNTLTEQRQLISGVKFVVTYALK